MIKKPVHVLAIIPLAFSSLLGGNNNQSFINPFPSQYVLAQKEMSLGNRYGNKASLSSNDKFVNDVFKDNILLNLAYLAGRVTSVKDIKWEEITKPFQYEFQLEPNKTFAFHSDVKTTFQDSLVKTTNAHFNAADGFKTDGYLYGDGVCHLASLINWVAQEAGLAVEAPTNHDFAAIPDVPKKYGVSIYSNPGARGANAQQNLYITNNKNRPISFKFEYLDNKVKVSVIELN